MMFLLRFSIYMYLVNEDAIYILQFFFQCLSHKLLLQAGALVNIYTDGSVLVSHAGVELGQGLDTKMIQVGTNVTFSYHIITSYKCE